MQTITQLEDSIRTLPAGEFFQLLDWMCDKHLEVISRDGFESCELEAEILKALESPRVKVDDAFFEGMKQRANAAAG